MRANGTLSYLLADHLGSTSMVVKDIITGAPQTDVISVMRYKPWGEVRFAWSTNTSLPTPYTFTGQYSDMDDPTTTGTAEGFGLMFYNARWYDPVIGRFAQADSVVPDGVQGYDRYAYVKNNPLRYTDPTGHRADEGCGTGGTGCNLPATNAPKINKDKNNKPVAATTVAPIVMATATPTPTLTATVTPACTNPSYLCATIIAGQATYVAFENPTATATATATAYQQPPNGMDFVESSLNTCTTAGSTCGSDFLGSFPHPVISSIGKGFDVLVNGGHFIGERIEDTYNEPPMTQQEARRGLAVTLGVFFTSVLPWVLSL